MQIFAGIDEAGYGPMFGPFVIARAVLAIDDAPSDAEPPDLWQRLSRCCCRQVRDKRRRIAVNDSKMLYTPSQGIAHLERGTLAFAGWAGHEPMHLDQWLGWCGLDEDSRTPRLLWYHDETGCPFLPTVGSADQVAIARTQLMRAGSEAGMEMLQMRAAVVYEDRFNEIIARTRSKAACGWQFVSQHLWDIWQAFGQHGPWVVVDRQGGRKVYHRMLQDLFEGATLRLLDESEDISRYHITAGRRSMTISFETGSEERHMPVALASMTAKYTRELLMHRFNRFWRTQVPDLKPTAGYVQDGRRFLKEIDIHIDRLSIDRQRLVRNC